MPCGLLPLSKILELVGQGDVIAEIVFAIAVFRQQLDVFQNPFVADENRLDRGDDVDLSARVLIR